MHRIDIKTSIIFKVVVNLFAENNQDNNLNDIALF